MLNESGDAGFESRAVVSRKDGESVVCSLYVWLDEEIPDQPTREIYHRKAVG